MDFVDTYGLTFPIVWDPSFESWIELGINGQPAGLLATPAGELMAQWRGEIPMEEVLETAASL